MSFVVLDVFPVPGVPAVAALVGGCTELRAVCRPVMVRGAAAVMADAEAARGESATSAAEVDVCGERATTTTRGESATVMTGVSAPGHVRGGGDRRQRVTSSPRSWRRRRWEQQRQLRRRRAGGTSQRRAEGVQDDVDDDVGMALLEVTA